MKEDRQKTILITGGAGFIGSHLCERLLKDGHKVICVDSFFSGKKENIAPLLKNKNFTLIKHNIIYPLKKRFKKIDEIYNLACPASPLQYQFDPILTLRTSVEGTRNMLELARRYGARFLQASTSEVYGDPLEHPQKEEYFGNVNPLGKRSCYDEGKRAAESLCKDYREHYGVDARIVRLFNIYGPKMMFNDGRVISNFVLQALLGEDITVHGRGEQSRSFMYIDDLIEAFLKVMDLPPEKIGLGPLNLGNPQERTIKDLAYLIKELTGSKSQVVFIDYEKIPERLGDPQRRCPDITRAKSILGWEPRVGFREGLHKTIADFEERLKNKTKILVFIPQYLPEQGPAEQAVAEITQRLIGYDFHLVTSRMDKKLPRQEKIGRVQVYRIGWGSRIDKYLLPWWGVGRALALKKRNNYEAVWGVMASYGGLAGVIFSWLSRISLLVTLFPQKKKKIWWPIYRFIFQRAHHLQVLAEMSDKALAWLSDEKKLRPLDLERGWDYLAKKTKEEFQELEVLTSRL